VTARILVTGGTGKVGQVFIRRFLAEPRFERFTVRPLVTIVSCWPGRGAPVKRNFVHVDDLVGAVLAAIDHPKARQQNFNVCMNEPVDYAELAAYLNERVVWYPS
jgi:nucleoside-diphosphate-sugar epimerase